MGFVLVMLEGIGKVELILKAAQPLLKKLQDVLIDNLPIKLPPLREINMP